MNLRKPSRGFSGRDVMYAVIYGQFCTPMYTHTHTRHTHSIRWDSTITEILRGTLVASKLTIIAFCLAAHTVQFCTRTRIAMYTHRNHTPQRITPHGGLATQLSSLLFSPDTSNTHGACIRTPHTLVIRILFHH